MLISDEDVKEYIELHYEVKGERLSFDEAYEIVQRMLDLFTLLCEPLLGERSTDGEHAWGQLPSCITLT